MEQGLTNKGDRQATAIIEAALRCLVRDGFAATSLQRVGDEAGVSKRVVLYYYGSRAGLFTQLARHVGDELTDGLRAAIAGLERPEDIAERSFQVLWEAITTDRSLLVAWFGLHAEAISDPELRDAASSITDGLRSLVGAVIDDIVLRGYTLLIERATLKVLVLAGIQGLTLAYLEKGDSDELQRAIRTVQGLLASASSPPGVPSPVLRLPV